MKYFFQKSFIQKKTNRLIRRNATLERYFKNYDNIKNILLLAELADIHKYEEIKKIGRNFKRDGKKVEIAIFVNDEVTYNFLSSDKEAKVFKKQNFSWVGKAHQELVNELLGFDLLINLNETSTIYADYLTLLADAGLKVGSSKNNQEILDFMVDTGTNHDLQFLADQIIFYLRTIKSKRR